MRIGHIYSLNDPIDKTPRYIGYSCYIEKRFASHLNSSEKTHKGNWIRSLKKIGLKPELEIIDTVCEKEIKFWEMHYISLYKSWGFNLTNGTLGGDGTIGHKYTEQQILNVLNTKLKKGLIRPGKILFPKRREKKAIPYENMLGALNPGKKQCIPVLQYSLDGVLIAEYESAKAASLATGFNRANISRASRGIIGSIGGFVWIRKGDTVGAKIALIKINRLFAKKKK